MADERFRSWLFAPADVPDRCRKAYQSRADQVIWDLEDAVPPDRKDFAREAVLTLLGEVGQGERRPWVRINSLQSGRGEEDLRQLWAALPPERRRFAVPKTDQDVLRELATYRSGAEWLFLVESVDGFLDFLLHPGIWQGEAVRLSFGALDYQLDLGGQTGPDETELLVPRTILAWASRRRRFLPPIDTVYPQVSDEEGLRRSAERAKRLGFAGKLVVHPRQIDPVHQAFRPSPEERDWAERVLSAAEGRGAALVDGMMVDRPVLDRARTIRKLWEEGGER